MKPYGENNNETMYAKNTEEITYNKIVKDISEDFEKNVDV